jgi:hypothetical protein
VQVAGVEAAILPLREVSSARTRIEGGIDSEAIRRMKRQAERDLSVSGPLARSI